VSRIAPLSPVTPSRPYRGKVRASPELLKVFGPATCLPAQVVEETAEWLVDKLLDPFSERRQAKPKRKRGAGVIGGAYWRSRELAKGPDADRSHHNI